MIHVETVTQIMQLLRTFCWRATYVDSDGFIQVLTDYLCRLVRCFCTGTTDVRSSVRSYRGRSTEDASLSHNDKIGATGSYNFTAYAAYFENRIHSDSQSQDLSAAGDTIYYLRRSTFEAGNLGSSGTFSSNLQWKWGQGEQLTLQPFMTANKGGGSSQTHLIQSDGITPQPYSFGMGHYSRHAESGRLSATYLRQLNSDWHFELRASVGALSSSNNSDYALENSSNQLQSLQRVDSAITNKQWSTTWKLTNHFADTHKLVAGIEVAGNRATDDTTTTINDIVQLPQFGTQQIYTSLRRAWYMQDEWDPTAAMSAYAGLRWESIETRSDTELFAAKNTSSVLTPLAHLLWRLDSVKKDQVRLSVTNSYRPPGPGELISRPRVNFTNPAPGPNDPFSADFSGNPALGPERAIGVDLAFEHYLKANGVVSLSLFTRRISDLIRQVTELETVSWATSQRYVTRPRNIGAATHSGIEFDTKFQLKEIWSDAPTVNIRVNFSVFRSHVDFVPGPNNRMLGVPSATGNFGGDFRFATLPLLVGGNINVTPAFESRQTESQSTKSSLNRNLELFALWTVTPKAKIRFALNNFLPRDTPSQARSITDGHDLTSSQQNPGRTSGVIRLELRL